MIQTLLRVLFPSWRFFDQMGSQARLLYRAQKNSSSPWGEWQRAPEFPARQLSSLFLNSPGNLNLALQSLVDRAAQEISQSSGSSDWIQSVTYRQLESWVHQLCRDGNFMFQFKIEVADPQTPKQFSDVLVSAELPC